VHHQGIERVVGELVAERRELLVEQDVPVEHEDRRRPDELGDSAGRQDALRRGLQRIAVSAMPAAESASRWWKRTGLFATGASCREDRPRLGHGSGPRQSVARTTAFPTFMVTQRTSAPCAFAASAVGRWKNGQLTRLAAIGRVSGEVQRARSRWLGDPNR
jgi:hypothetical protein